MKNKTLKILTHVAFWVAFTLIPMGFANDMNMDFARSLQHSLMRTLSFVLIFYMNYLWLIDKHYIDKQKYVFTLVNLILISLMIWVKTLHFFDFLAPNMQDMSRPRPDNFRFYMDFLLLLIPIAIAVVIKTTDRLSAIQIKQAEDKQTLLQHELQYLKYQLQPHFFFNSLNTIYSLIDLDSEKAKETVHDLGKLMRYLLYRTDEEKVDLAQEVSFIEQYISLMQLRMRKNTTIKTDFPKDVPLLAIAPLLFIPIVENAFKHGVSGTEASELIFSLRIDDKSITFTGENTDFAKSEQDKSGSGIGIENLKKRLNLLYPNRHTYSNQTRDGRYFTVLKIEV